MEEECKMKQLIKPEFQTLYIVQSIKRAAKRYKEAKRDS